MNTAKIGIFILNQRRKKIDITFLAERDFGFSNVCVNCKK